MNEKEKKEMEKMAYEKAIDGYQFLVNRYHTWMNYYSIFTGAFFVALYTVWDKGDTAQSACCKCCNAVASSADNFLPFVIIILGWVASVCWLASLIGHRAWMGSWIQIVKKWENQVLRQLSDEYTTTPSDELWSSIYGKVAVPNTPNTTPPYLARFISTQKVTTIFVYAVILAWDILLGYLLVPVCDLYHAICNCEVPSNWIAILIKVSIYLLFLGLNWFCLWRIYKKTNKCYSDDLTDMIQ